ncbi:MAG: hypothetical protein M0Q90_09205 [Bacteroidales bacterium]|nr:hypothetical protein [Bacteroidales bacterium]
MGERQIQQAVILCCTAVMLCPTAVFVGDDVETHGRASLRATTNNIPATTNNIPATTNNIPATTNNITTNNFFRKPKSISSFVAGFKSVINSNIDDYIDEHNLNMPKHNRNNPIFQPNYYDHIIRNMTDKIYLCRSKAGVAQW